MGKNQVFALCCVLLGWWPHHWDLTGTEMLLHRIKQGVWEQAAQTLLYVQCHLPPHPHPQVLPEWACLSSGFVTLSSCQGLSRSLWALLSGIHPGLWPWLCTLELLLRNGASMGSCSRYFTSVGAISSSSRSSWTVPCCCCFCWEGHSVRGVITGLSRGSECGYVCMWWGGKSPKRLPVSPRKLLV